VFRCSEEKQKTASEVFDRLQTACATALANVPAAVVGPRDTPNSMLQAKLALAAERLLTPTSLLILDEPAWCLSRPLARAYISVVAKECHDRNIALLLISHRNEWWRGIAVDALQMIEADGAVRIVVAEP